MTRRFQNGGSTGVGNLGYESALSTYVGPYVTDMLGRGQAVASQPYQGYTGDLTAGPVSYTHLTLPTKRIV